MLRSVFTKWLWDARRSVLGWSLAIVLVGGGYAAFWPTINDPAMQAFTFMCFGSSSARLTL